jgi:hypothetical protein
MPNEMPMPPFAAQANAASQTPGPALTSPPPSSAAARKAELDRIDQMESKLGVSSHAGTASTVETGKAQWTPELAERMGAGIFVFAVVLFLMLSILIWKNKSVDSLLRTFGILLIIIAAVFLVIVGYSDQQIAPVMGLMGTIAGYLLSRRTDPLPGGNGGITPDAAAAPSAPGETRPSPPGV